MIRALSSHRKEQVRGSDKEKRRKIQHLGDLRNLCDHKKKIEPTIEDIDKLIQCSERKNEMKKYGFVLLACILFFTLFNASVVYAQTSNDTVRVVCVGNSITAGWTTINATTDAYPAQLGSMLGNKWIVYNSGVSGRTMLRHGDYPIWNEPLFKTGLAFNPDIVTILLGTNDSKSWNWIYKDEFVNDYKAMIDTFRTLPSHPVVWLGLPAPAFRDTLGIRDSIITNDIIPMIRQIALDKGCQILDFNTAMKSYAAFFSDGIHPNTTGSEAMAEVVYKALTGNSVTRVQDENCATKKTVSVSGSIDSALFGGGNLVDGDRSTTWTTRGFPSKAIVDFGSIQKVDFFQLDFGNYANAGYQYQIETATTAGLWTTAIDSTARNDTASVFVLTKTDSIQARYVRLTITGAVHPRGDTVSVAEFRIVKANGGAHVPAMIIKKISANKINAVYSITLFWPNGAKGALMMYQRTGQNGLFLATSGFKPGSSSTVQQYVKVGNVYAYCTESFLDGVETFSDTISVDTNPTDVNETELRAIPAGIVLQQCYPNPFNPSTNISFSLPKKSFVSLKVFDLLGREVATLVSEEMSAGSYSQQWNATGMPSGVYFYRLQARQTSGGQAGSFTQTKKLVLLR
jgi:lysophospholipase L1-like esterase